MCVDSALVARDVCVLTQSVHVCLGGGASKGKGQGGGAGRGQPGGKGCVSDCQQLAGSLGLNTAISTSKLTTMLAKAAGGGGDSLQISRR